MQSIVFTIGFLALLLPSALTVYLQSYYPFISYHNPFGVVHPPVHAHGFYNPAHAHGAQSQYSARHGHAAQSPVEVITIPIAVLKRLLLSEIKEDKPVVLAFDGKNYTLPFMETMKIMNATSSLRMEPKPELGRLVVEIEGPTSTVTPIVNVTETFGQRLFVSSPEPASSYNGVEGSA